MYSNPVWDALAVVSEDDLRIPQHGGYDALDYRRIKHGDAGK